MTSIEKDQQIKELLFKHWKAERELCHLEEKAASLADRLSAVAEKLRPRGAAAAVGATLEEASIYDDMTFLDAISLVKEIKQAKDQLKDLEERKNRLT
jgi:hypothetical protein